jgi:hypothetical protein
VADCSNCDRLGALWANADAGATAWQERADVWMNAVADVVEPYGFDREAACGPADLLPGLRWLAEDAALWRASQKENA